MQTHEFKVVTVSASNRKQTKELNKYATKGWEIVDTKHVFGAGVTTVHLRRPIETRASTTPTARFVPEKSLPSGKPADAYEGRPPVFRHAIAQLFGKK